MKKTWKEIFNFKRENAEPDSVQAYGIADAWSYLTRKKFSRAERDRIMGIFVLLLTGLGIGVVGTVLVYRLLG